MQPDVVRATARNWREQARAWSQEAEFHPGGGYAEVAFLLNRAAAAADACAEGAVLPPEPQADPDAEEGVLREG